MDFKNVLIIDGYIDTPGCLGVPPYLAPLPRYIYGVLKKNQIQKIKYQTIDQIRTKIRNFKDELSEKQEISSFREELMRKAQEIFKQFDLAIFITGVSVPGKYLGRTPIKFTELRKYSQYFPGAIKILCGPATNYGIGEEGGKPSVPVEKLKKYFDLTITGDSEIALSEFLNKDTSFDDEDKLQQIEILERKNINELNDISIFGAEIINQHPNFYPESGGNLICEIETFQGCPRYKTGGCAFCIEPLKGRTQHRDVDAVIKEVHALYQIGVRHFRIGSQTDFYAFHHGNFDFPRYPRPNPPVIKKLLKNIRDLCPEIKTLHIDNVNALNFVLYPKEAEEITKIITKYCTPGNVAAIGVESVDPIVIKINNLKATTDEITSAIEIINRHGKSIGSNGNPLFLPGLNFIMGLPGETQETLGENTIFLQSILDKDLWVRRINLRKFMVSSSMPQQIRRKISKHLQKFNSKYFHWKAQIRNKIDFPMLKKIYPFGRILKDAYAEVLDGKGTLLRQPGTYPITCFVPKELPLNQFYDLIIVDHGFRSLVCLEYPVHIPNLSQKELKSINGIGRNRARQIQQIQNTYDDKWEELEPEIHRIMKVLLKTKEK
ncbi:MAG: radical SAM protein [Promethearchaeota archaeon]